MIETNSREHSGTTPPGTSDEKQASRWVQRMFEEVAPRYDLLNHLLSFNIDRGWRKRLVQSLEQVLVRPGSRTLDLCCGTGDVLFDLETVARSSVLGADFCHPMLVNAKNKAERMRKPAALFEADALSLPLGDESLDAISIAFGFRNLSNYKAGLAELSRVLKPQGVLAILEFSHPPSRAVNLGYGIYSRLVLPLIGGAISGCREAYTYLPDSIRKFPRAAELCNLMRAAGFDRTRYELLTGGIAALHTGEKPA